MEMHTFSRRQMDQLSSALQILIDGNLLDEGEKDAARKLMRKFKGAKVGEYSLPSGEPYATVYVSEEEEELLMNVEASLWRR